VVKENECLNDIGIQKVLGFQQETPYADPPTFRIFL